MIQLDDSDFDAAAGIVAGSAPRVQTAPNPFETEAPAAPAAPSRGNLTEAAAHVAQGQRQQLRTSLYDSLLANPEVAARANVLGRKTGLPSDLVERNMPEVQRNDQLNEYDKLIQNSPQLAAYLGVAQNARAAHDDVTPLSAVESTIGAITGPRADFWSVTRGLVNSLPQGARLAREGIRLQLADLYETLGLFGRDASERARQDALRNYSQANLEQDLSRPQIENDTLRGIYSGGESLLRTAPGLAASILTRSAAPTLAAAGVQTEAEAYGKYRERGATAGQALAGAVGEGATEVATEFLPMSFLTSRFGRAGAGEFLTGLLAREVPSEQVATFVQDALDTAIANPDKTWQQFLEDRPGAAYQTLVATITQSGIIGAASGIAGRVGQRQQQAADAERNAQTLAALAAAAESSKLRTRDNVSFEDFVAQAADNGPVQDVFISAAALQQSGVPLDDLAAASPSVREQLADAIETGGDIRIPVEEFAARLSGPEFAQPLIPHLRTDPTAMSQFEAQEYLQSQGAELQAEVERTLSVQQGNDAFKASRDEVQTNIMAQLQGAGRFTDDVNSAYANLVANFYAVQAARLGTTPAELAERYPLQIRADRPTDGRALDQSQAAEPGSLVDRVQRPPSVASWTHTNSEAWAKPWAALKRLASDGKVTEADAARVKAIAREGQDGAGAKLAGLVQDIRQRPAAPAQTAQLEQPAQMTGARGSISLADDITESPSIITLLQKADLSTFLHESGHFFLEVLNHVASQENAPQELQDDMATVLKWFGVPDLATWNGYDIEQKRDYHEQFARGFEAYLFEGKSPSTEMAGLFQRFRAWLLNVYRSLTQLNVELDDEVRGVFDRMLASSDQIAEAEAVRGYGSLFDTKPDFMTADEWTAYQRLGTEATQEAITNLESRSLRDMRWLSNAKSRVIRDLQAQAREKRAAVRAEVAAEVMAEPINRARQFLKRGEITGQDGAVSQAEGPTKLNVNDLVEMYGGEGDRYALLDWKPLGAGKYGMTAQDGLHPDTVAELFGFSSGDQLVRQLLSEEDPQQKIDGITDQRMLERYGDLTDERSIARAADAALHDEARLRFLATEINALNKAVGSRPILARAAKQFAEATIARLRVRDLRPSQYAAAAARAARAADKAFKAGDIQTAAAEKRNQLVNSYADRAAHDAQTGVAKTVDYLNKFNSDGTRKNLDIDYLEQIDALLARFDLRKGQTLTAIDRRRSLAEWAAQQAEMGIEPEIPPELLDEARRKSFKDLTVEELRGLRDTVKQIEHLARLKHKLLTARDQREYEAIRDEIAAGIEEHAGDRQADTRTPTTNLGRAQQNLRRFWSAHLKVNTLARVLDGGLDGGPVWEYFVRSANERGDAEATQRAEATQKLSEILAPVFKLGKMGGKGVFFPSINRSLNREARLTLALNTGNASNLQRLLGGEGWTRAQIQPVLDSLTKTEWDAVQQIWDHFESYRPQIAAKERRVYGKEPDWVDPTPVQTAFGEYRGGYYPIKYDPAASQRAEEHTDAEGARRQLQGAYTSATTRRSFTKNRAEEVHGRPLLYTLTGLYSGVNDVIHDLNWHEWLIDVNRLLKSEKIDRAIREKYGPEVKAQFKSWVKDIAEGEKGSDNAIDQALGKLRQNVSVAGLGFNIMSAAMQGLGITQSIVRVGPKWIGQGVAAYMAAPIRSTKMTTEKSEFMRNRTRTQYRELNELRNVVQGGDHGDVIKKHAYVMMMRAQQMVDVPTWIGAYEKAIADSQPEDRAVHLADQAVIDAQGGGQTKDLSAIERGGQAQRLFTVFYSFMNTALNIGVGQTMTARSRARLASDYLLLYSVPAVLGFALKQAITPGDDDWDKIAGKLLAEQVGYLMGLMVLVREFGEAAKAMVPGEHTKDYAGPSGVRTVVDVYKFGAQVKQGEFDDAFRKAAVNLTGDLFGVPSAQVNRTITGAQAIAEGKTDNPAAIAFGFQPKR